MNERVFAVASPTWLTNNIFMQRVLIIIYLIATFFFLLFCSSHVVFIIYRCAKLYIRRFLPWIESILYFVIFNFNYSRTVYTSHISHVHNETIQIAIFKIMSINNYQLLSTRTYVTCIWVCVKCNALHFYLIRKLIMIYNFHSFLTFEWIFSPFDVPVYNINIILISPTHFYQQKKKKKII